MSLDISDFEQSLETQSIADDGSPFVSRKYNYVNDINSSVYQNSQASLVQFDLSSIFTSDQLIDPKHMYLVIPTIYTAAWTTAAALIAPVTGNEFLVTPKSGSYNLIQSVECIVNGETVVQQQSNINFFTNFRILSQMNPSDLLAWGKTLGIYPDDVHSIRYNGQDKALSVTVGPVGGNGLSNNFIFPVTSAGVAGVANGDQQSAWAAGGALGQVYNSGLQERSKRISQTNSGTAGNNVIGTVSTAGILSQSNLNNEFRPNYQVLNTFYMTWTDYAIIKLGDIMDFFAQAPLMKGMSALVRLYVNTGFLTLQVAQATNGGMSLSGANSTFTNTCPFTVNTPPVAMCPAAATGLSVSCNIARSSVSNTLNSFATLSNSGGASAMLACRVYYPMVKLKPRLEKNYLDSNRRKEILYRNVVSNTYQGITSGSVFNQIVQSGIVNPTGILILPFLSGSTNGRLDTTTVFTTPIVTFQQYSSCFDTAPATTSPVSLTQLNVSLGGLPVLPYNYSYSFENFIQEVSVYEKLAPVNQYGQTCGLISQFMWESGYRMYWINLGRGAMGDLMTPRSISVSFLNNSLQTIDIWCFIEAYKSMYVDVSTGRLSSA